MIKFLLNSNYKRDQTALGHFQKLCLKNRTSFNRAGYSVVSITCNEKLLFKRIKKIIKANY